MVHEQHRETAPQYILVIERTCLESNKQAGAARDHARIAAGCVRENLGRLCAGLEPDGRDPCAVRWNNDMNENQACIDGVLHHRKRNLGRRDDADGKLARSDFGEDVLEGLLRWHSFNDRLLEVDCFV